MLERICAHCGQGNQIENDFCGSCGVPLAETSLAQRETRNIMRRVRNLPAIPMKQVSRVAAVGISAIAVELVMRYMRRRKGGSNKSASSLALYPNRRTKEVGVDAQTRGNERIIGRRITEVWQNRRLSKRVVETVAIERDQDK